MDLVLKSHAVVDYARHVMSDGRWRTAADVANRAKRDGFAIGLHSAGKALGKLAETGIFETDCKLGHRMWRMAEAAQ